MTRLTTEDAGDRLHTLISAVLAGEEVEFVQDGKAVARLVAIKTSSDEAASSHGHEPLSAHPAVGMWADRKDMADGAAWVAEQREKAWRR